MEVGQCVYAALTLTCLTSILSPMASPVHLAVLLPYDPGYQFSIDKVLPAIESVVDHVNDVIKIRFNVTLVVHSGDSECNAIGGPLAAFDFYQRREVNVFLGPVDEDGLFQVARYSTRWQIPVISAGGFGPDLA